MLLLDEPLSNLDPLARREFMQVLMDAVAEEGLTVVLSSHIIADLERTCDYLVILAQGQVQLAGEIEGASRQSSDASRWSCPFQPHPSANDDAGQAERPPSGGPMGGTSRV
jgi:ABC-type multidrug transport system ATPase subunit